LDASRTDSHFTWFDSLKSSQYNSVKLLTTGLVEMLHHIKLYFNTNMYSVLMTIFVNFSSILLTKVNLYGWLIQFSYRWCHEQCRSSEGNSELWNQLGNVTVWPWSTKWLMVEGKLLRSLQLSDVWTYLCGIDLSC